MMILIRIFVDIIPHDRTADIVLKVSKKDLNFLKRRQYDEKNYVAKYRLQSRSIASSTILFIKKRLA